MQESQTEVLGWDSLLITLRNEAGNIVEDIRFHDCADYGRLAEQFEVLNQLADAYHWDMVDGHYAQSLSLNLI